MTRATATWGGSPEQHGRSGPVRERPELRWRRRRRASPRVRLAGRRLGAHIVGMDSARGLAERVANDRPAGTRRLLPGCWQRSRGTSSGGSTTFSPASVVAAAAWFSVVMLISRGRWIGRRRRRVAGRQPGWCWSGCARGRGVCPVCHPVRPGLAGRVVRSFGDGPRGGGQPAGWSPSGSRRQPSRRWPIWAGIGIRMQRDDGGLSLVRAALGVTLFVIGSGHAEA